MIFGDSVELSKNSWYVKMLRKMWGTGWEKFNNLCPLFWSVVLSILVFPLWLVISPFVKMTKKIWMEISVVIAVLGSLWMSILFSGLIGSTFIYPFLIWKEGGRWDEWICVITALGLLLIGLVIFVGVGIALITIVRIKEEGYLADTKIAKTVNGAVKVLGLASTPAIWIFKPFKWIYELGKLVCAFVYHEFYKKNCPHINWK